MFKSVKFKNRANTLAGNLHLPEGFDKSKKYPALVGIHPAGGVKEQVIGLYAEKLCKHGYVVLVYDSSFQGESEGEPRLLEDPTVRVEDARCAADYLTTLPFVNAERMGVYGICAGGGYAISVTQTERRFKAVATVSAAPIGEGYRNYLGTATPPAELIKMLETAANLRTAEINGAAPSYTPFVPERFEDINENTPDLLREGYEYYRTPRGQHPSSKGRFLTASMDKLLAYSAYDHITDYLSQPMLIIAGSKADTRLFSEMAFELSNGPKELVLVEGATHIAMYDVPEYVEQAVNKMVRFFEVL
ncbi:alpha/beta hydrolase [Flavobacterium soyae]|uniref:Alpha/beta hydrolase n=1 Tax=Flavobacterium soyae TaxID=2903098 RepID=A0ABZ2UK51_9FLAO|nr:alpha/beta hydrolase [Flavobacterium soyae]MCD9575474.1 alpha/beta hydrolase [Flavobacterium soyae]